MENYIVQQVERCKNLRPVLSEHEIILKLAYHFYQNVRLTIYTQSIKKIEDMLILVLQSEHLLKEYVIKKGNYNDNKITEDKKS